MKSIFIILSLIFVNTCLANTVWYDPVSGREGVSVVDKTKAEIISELNTSDQVEVVTLKKCENYQLIDNVFSSYDVCKERADKKKDKDDNKDAKKELIKTKLGLSNGDFENLKEALGL